MSIGASAPKAKTGNGDDKGERERKREKTETRAFTPASVLLKLGDLSSSLLCFGGGIFCLIYRLRATEVEAGQLQNRLVYFHCLSVNFLGEDIDGKPPGEENFASLGYGLHYALTKTVPAIYIDPKSLFFLFFAAVFSYSKTELNNFVAGVSEAHSAGILSDSADDGQLIVHDRHLQCVLGAPGLA